MLWTEKRRASMYARPIIHDPTMDPTTARGASSSARWTSSATCAAVSQPSSVYTAYVESERVTSATQSRKPEENREVQRSLENPNL